MSEKNACFDWKDSVSLKQYFETIITELRSDYREQVKTLEQKMDLRFQARQIADDKSETSINLRLAGMNEFRNAMKDQASHFLSKEEYEVRHQNLIDKLDTVTKIVNMGLGAVFILEITFKFFIK